MYISIYASMIAGSLPAHAHGTIDDTIQLVAREALGTSEIHFLRSEVPHNGKYHYFAVPSKAMASTPSPVTELAAALPGHPLHQGRGLYVIEHNGHRAVALFDGAQLDYVFNDHDVIEDLLAEQADRPDGQQLPVIQLTPGVETRRFQSGYTVSTQGINSLTRVVSKYSVITLAVGSILLAGMFAADGWLSVRINADKHNEARSLRQAIVGLKLGSPLSQHLAEYQQRAGTVVRAGGWIDNYQVANGTESFRLFMPQWVTKNYMVDLGPGVTAEPDRANDQLLAVTKGTPNGGDGISSANALFAVDAAAPRPPGDLSGTPGAPLGHHPSPPNN